MSCCLSSDSKLLLLSHLALPSSLLLSPQIIVVRTTRHYTVTGEVCAATAFLKMCSAWQEAQNIVLKLQVATRICLQHILSVYDG